MAWLYVPASADSNSVSNSPLETADTPVWVTSSGKPTQRQPSWPGWKTRPWILRLSGMISRPSMAARGAEKWMSSLADTPANRSAQPVTNLAQTIQDTCGPIFDELCERSGPDSASSRTYQDTSRTDSSMSSLIFGCWDTDGPMTTPCFISTKTATLSESLVKSLRSDSLARRKWAQTTYGIDCSSWPTAKTLSGGPETKASRATRGAGSEDLQTRAQGFDTPEPQWSTPSAVDHKPVGSAEQSRAEQGEPLKCDRRLRNDAANFETPVPGRKDWSTPNSGDGIRGRQEPDGRRGILLGTQSRDFRTPRWATIRAMEAGDYTRDRGEQGGERPTLTGQARGMQTPTPAPRKWVSPAASSECQERCGKPDKGRTSSKSGRTLTGLVLEVHGLGPHATAGVSPSFPPAPTTSHRGPKSMALTLGLPRLYRMLLHFQWFQDRIVRRLNPSFVEWLMGWPIGWTGLGPLETGSFQSWLRRHSSALLLELHREAERLTILGKN